MAATPGTRSRGQPARRGERERGGLCVGRRGGRAGGAARWGPTWPGSHQLRRPHGREEPGRGRRAVGFRGRRGRERCTPYAYAPWKEAAAPRGWTRVRAGGLARVPWFVARCWAAGPSCWSSPVVRLLDCSPRRLCVPARLKVRFGSSMSPSPISKRCLKPLRFSFSSSVLASMSSFTNSAL